jgi:hypothetical protein
MHFLDLSGLDVTTEVAGLVNERATPRRDRRFPAAPS